jgi:hypothetical protein
VAVDLAGGVQTISAAKVSALLRPAPASPTDLPLVVGQEQDDDPDSGSRFTALRAFALQACTSGCDDPANYTTFFTSSDDAFPGGVPRPVAPDQTMRTFRFPAVQAAAVRLVTLENQCTGQAAYAGDQDDDPTNDTDCATGSDRGTIVHAAELQVFGDAIPDDPSSTGGPTGPGVHTDAGAPPPDRAVATRTRIRLPQVWQVRGRESTVLRYQVVGRTVSGGAPVGVAVVRLDGRTVATVRIAVTAKHGRTVLGRAFRVPRSLGYGEHRLQVRFRSDDPSAFTSSRSRPVVLTVVKERPTGG